MEDVPSFYTFVFQIKKKKKHSFIICQFPASKIMMGSTRCFAWDLIGKSPRILQKQILLTGLLIFLGMIESRVLSLR